MVINRQKPVVFTGRATHIQRMDDAYEDIRKAVLDAALPEITFDGWSDDVLARAGEAAGIDDNSLHLAFSGGVGDLIAAFSSQGDAVMLATLDTPDDMKIRDRIRHAVRVRLEADTDHREAARRAAGWLSLPGRQALGGRLVYATADHIWHWAGDKATDYNHYSKRLILSGVLGATRLVWFGDESDGNEKSWAFLDRRIENVMQFEKAKAKWQAAGEGKTPFSDLLSKLARQRYKTHSA